MSKNNRIVVRSDEEAYKVLKPLCDSLYALGYSPRMVYYLIDPAQTGFAKVCGAKADYGQVEAMFWDSYEAAQVYRDRMKPIGYCFEVRATILVEDGVAIVQKEAP